MIRDNYPTPEDFGGDLHDLSPDVLEAYVRACKMYASGLLGELEEARWWHDAGYSVDAAWERVGRSTNIVDQANALVDLSNAVSDLITYLPKYDPRTGTIPAEEE